MTPKEIKEMNSYLTRKDTKTPEQRAKINKQNNLKEKQRLLDKRKGYGINDNNYLESEINKLTKELSEDKITTKQRPIVKDHLTKQLINANHTFDGGPYIVDNETGEVVSEAELKRRFSYQDKPYPKQATEAARPRLA